MQKFFPFHFRGTSGPTVSLPISCRSVGHYVTFAGWHNPSVAKPFVELFWGIRGSGVFKVDRKEYCLKPDEVAVLFPGDVHHKWEFPIEEVARQTGFARGNYFTRVIRKHAGMIPREIRKKGWS